MGVCVPLRAGGLWGHSVRPKDRRHTTSTDQRSSGEGESEDGRTKIPERKMGVKAKGERDRTLAVCSPMRKRWRGGSVTNVTRVTHPFTVRLLPKDSLPTFLTWGVQRPVSPRRSLCLSRNQMVPTHSSAVRHRTATYRYESGALLHLSQVVLGSLRRKSARSSHSNRPLPNDEAYGNRNQHSA